MAEVQDIINHYYPPETHPYRVLERTVDQHIRPDTVLLEVGCGRTAPVLSGYVSRCARAIGIDLVEFTIDHPSMTLIQGDISDMSAIPSGSVDLIYSRSVMEHVVNVEGAYGEIARVLKPGGRYIFLTPSFWDYASLIAHVVPNRFHGKIVKHTEGREEIDTFPTAYRSNTESAIARLARKAGLEIRTLDFLGQYSNYLAFNRLLFRWGCLYAKFLDRHHMLRRLRGWIMCELRKASE